MKNLLQQKAFIPLLALIAGAVGISFAPIFVRQALPDIGPSAIAFWRCALAMPFFWIWGMLAARSKSAAKPSLKSLLWLALPGLFFAADLTVWHLSIQYTTVANATLLPNFAAVLVAIVSWVWFGEKFTWQFLVGTVLAFAGMPILLGTDISNPLYFKGDLLALLTATFYAGYLIAIKKLRGRLDTITVMTWSTLASALVILPVVLFEHEALWPQHASTWGILVGLALISQVAGQGLIAYAFAHLPAGFSSLSLLLQPILATVWAWFILAEKLSLEQIAAGSIVLVGIFLARLGNREKVKAVAIG